MDNKDKEKGPTDTEIIDADLTEKQEPFKKPLMCLVGPRKSKGTKIRIVDSPSESKAKEGKVEVTEVLAEEVTEHEMVEVTLEPDKKIPIRFPEELECKPSKISQNIPAQKLKETPIPYLEPKWGGVPSPLYSLDVIKSGTVLDPIDLSDKSYLVFGRQTNCDVQMAHPTVSRHHAVLQYSKGTDEKPQGFYLYDLGSTHGTFLNKNRVRPEMFIRIKVGYQIKLGASSRLYLLQGPSDDMEAESDLTVTELKAKRQAELQARELAEVTRKQKEEEEKKKREEEGIDWGMGDDADEETDLSENPYAITTNEELYIDDPKKTLRGWFEREGHELEYDVEEKGPGQFLCRVDVPVEGARGGCMVAEALVKGKKKEAVAQCALEACRLLDRLGLLRQATHESRKRKAKNWEEEDFYDSDDDNFLDRTGAVEKKRQQRMKQAGKREDQVETYQSLSEKHANILKILESTQSQLQKAQADLAASKRKGGGDEDGDSLESFMSNLSNTGCVDKKQISQLKNDLIALNKEEAQLRKLVNIARPTSLPELVAPVSTANSSTSKGTTALQNKLMLAARKKANDKQKISACPLTAIPSASDDSVHGEVDEEDEGEGGERAITQRGNPVHEHITEDHPSPKGESKAEIHLIPKSKETTVIGPARPSFIKEAGNSEEVEEKSRTDTVKEKKSRSGNAHKEDNGVDKIEDEEYGDDNEKSIMDAEKRREKNRRRRQLRNEKALERTQTQYDPSDPNYSIWLPPEDQTGDGTTSLNAKLGY